MSTNEHDKTRKVRVGGADDAPREITLHFDRFVEHLTAHPEPDPAEERHFDSAAALLVGLWDPYPARPGISEEFEPGMPLSEQLLQVTDETLDHAHELIYASDPYNTGYRAHVDPAIYLTLMNKGWLSTSGERALANQVRPSADTTTPAGEFF